MIVARAVVVVLHAALGAVLGGRWPATGLAVLVAVVAPTASLWWHAGLGNLPGVHAYLLGLLSAWGIRAVARRRSAGPRPEPAGAAVGDAMPSALRTAALLFCLVVVVSTVLAVFRPEVPWRPRPEVTPGAALQGLLESRPTGAAARLHAAYVALLGPAILLVGVPALRWPRRRRRVRNAALAGLGVAVASPALALLVSDPWLRADLGRRAFGLSGFFGEPHSYAAGLGLGMGLALGGALGWSARQERRRALAALLLAASAAVVLLYTSSRGGLLAGVLTVSLLLGTVAVARLAGRPSDLPARIRTAAVGAVLAVILVAGPLVASATLRQAAHDRLVGLGNPRMWAPLQADWSPDTVQSVEVRRALWAKAGVLAASRPLWGWGPAGFGTTPVRLAAGDGTPLPETASTANAHNQFLQVAAEYGVPGLVAFVAIVLLTLAFVARGAWRADDPLDRWLLAGIAAGQAGFLAFCLVSHPLLLAEVQAIYWTLAALGVALAARATAGAAAPVPPRRWVVVAVGVYLALSAAELGRSRLVAAPGDRGDAGLSAWEQVTVPGAGGQTMLLRWSEGSSTIERPVGGAVLGLVLVRDPAAAAGTGTPVRFALDGELIDSHVLAVEGPYWFRYYLPPLLGEERWARVASLPGQGPGGHRRGASRGPGTWKELGPWWSGGGPPSIRLETTIGPGEVGSPTGVGIASLEWLDELPPGGIGFQEGGTDADGREFRWTRRRASLPLTVAGGEVVVTLRALHPDIEEVPVVVALHWNAGHRRTVVLSGRGWAEVPVIPGTPPGEDGVLTLAVDRTWSPARAGVSDDRRELGVAVAGVEWR